MSSSLEAARQRRRRGGGFGGEEGGVAKERFPEESEGEKTAAERALEEGPAAAAARAQGKIPSNTQEVEEAKQREL